MLPGPSLPPPMPGQMPIGQRPMGGGGIGQKPFSPSMGGQMQQGMGGMNGQQMQGGVYGGMAGQYQAQPMQPNRVDYAAQQRQMLHAHLQQQGQMAMRSQQSSGGGFFSRVFGGSNQASQQAVAQQRAAQAGQGGRRGLLSTLGFGRNQGATQTQSYAARRAEAYQTYKKQSMERHKMEKEIGRRQHLAESARSSSMQRFNTAKMERLQKKFDKGGKAFKKSYIDYKYTK